MFSRVCLLLKIVGAVSRLLLDQISSYLRSVVHFYTYRQLGGEATKNIVVVGCFFGGRTCADRLAGSIPSGWRVVVVDKNRHFGYTWLWPRVSVLRGHEDKSFIPCSHPPKWAPAGAYLFKHGKVVSFGGDNLVLEDGERVDFKYLVLATGTSCRYPYHLGSDTKKEGIAFFQERQQQVEAADRVAIIGGGPVGVEIALDLKSLYPAKSVSLIHSRSRLCNNYGTTVHDVCAKTAKEFGVEVMLNERPAKSEKDATQLELKNGEQLTFDLVIDCVGQRYGISALNGMPAHLASAEGFIKVRVTQQVSDPDMSNIFAIGDIADTGAPKMGRAAALQGVIAAKNILRSIQGKSLVEYVPGVVDQSIDLTLGLERHLVFMSHGDSSISFNLKTSDQTLHVESVWKMFNAPPFMDDSSAEKKAETEANSRD